MDGAIPWGPRHPLSRIVCTDRILPIRLHPVICQHIRIRALSICANLSRFIPPLMAGTMLIGTTHTTRRSSDSHRRNTLPHMTSPRVVVEYIYAFLSSAFLLKPRPLFFFLLLPRRYACARIHKQHMQVKRQLPVPNRSFQREGASKTGPRQHHTSFFLLLARFVNCHPSADHPGAPCNDKTHRRSLGASCSRQITHGTIYPQCRWSDRARDDQLDGDDKCACKRMMSRHRVLHCKRSTTSENASCCIPRTRH